MAIPASQIVAVNPRVIEAGGTDLVINGLFLTDSELLPLSSPAMSFSETADVGEYFGTTSHEYSAAAVYFNGYDDSFKKPQTVYFARRIAADAAGWLRGAAFTSSLKALQAITDGGLKITVDGTEYTASGVDFSACTSLSECASVLGKAISETAVTCTYSTLTKAFQITSATTGADSSVSYAEASGTGTELCLLLNLTQGTGAVLSAGSAALSVTENMNLILSQTQNWVTFTNLYEPEEGSGEEYALAEWANDQDVQYLYVCHSLDPQLLSQSDNSSLAVQFLENNLSGVTLIYGAMDYAAFIMGSAASIDWNRRQGTINFAFKAQDGLAATVENATLASTLLAKTCNFYGNYATRNDAFVWLYNGCMYGDYGFIDPYVNAIWFNAAIQVACMQGLKQSPRVPYNDDGYSLIRAWIMDPIQRAQKNGVIDAGVSLSESQKAELYREAGQDISGYLEDNGYYLQVEDAGASVRVNRESPNISLWYTYGGSVNKLEIASTLIL